MLAVVVATVIAMLLVVLCAAYLVMTGAFVLDSNNPYAFLVSSAHRGCTRRRPSVACQP